MMNTFLTETCLFVFGPKILLLFKPPVSVGFSLTQFQQGKGLGGPPLYCQRLNSQFSTWPLLTAEVGILCYYWTDVGILTPLREFFFAAGVILSFVWKKEYVIVPCRVFWALFA